MRDLFMTYPRSMVMGSLFLLLMVMAIADPPFEALDVMHTAQAQAEVRDSNAREEQLAVLDEAVTNRMLIKDHLIANLIEGEATLEETTAYFISMKRGESPGLGFMAEEPETTVEMRAARHVVHYAAGYLQADNPAHALVLERLSCELEEYLAR